MRRRLSYVPVLTMALLLSVSFPVLAQDTVSPQQPDGSTAGAAEGQAAVQEQEVPPTTQPVEKLDPLRNPRSMMAEFLLAVHDSEKEPERLKAAIRCLDLSELQVGGGQDITKQAPQCAKDLDRIIDILLNTYGKSREEIPEVPETDSIVFPQEGDIRLTLVRSEDGLWRFSAATVAAIPELLETANKRLEEEKEEKPEPKVLTEVPVAFQSARATMTTFVEAMKKGDKAAASACLDLSDKPEATRGEIGLKLSVDLAFVMDRIKQVVPQDLPARTDGEPYIWDLSEHGRIELARMEQGDKVGCWLFNQATVNSIPSLFDALKSVDRQSDIAESSLWNNPRLWILGRLPPSLMGKTCGVETWQWLGILLLLLVGYALHRLALLIFCGAAKLLGRSEYAMIMPSVITEKLRPISVLVMLVTWLGGLRILGIPIEIMDYVWPALKFVMTVVGVWASYRLIDLGAAIFEARAAKTTSRLDDVLVPLLRKLLKIVVVAVGFIFIMKALGISEAGVNKLFAGLGLGGLAFALAAKDTLSNFFGSVTVVLDRPFQVGDWVKVGEVEGTVESVGLRSCRIRTFYNSQITVPNADLMTSTVDNLGRRRYRRLCTKLGVTYSTPPEKLDAFCAGIRELIRRHPYTRKDYYNVWVNEFGASSINILLYCFHEAPEWTTELRERHRLILDIIRLARRLDVEFAFPTQTIHLSRESGEAGTIPVTGPAASAASAIPEALAEGQDGEEWGRRVAMELAKESFREPGDKPPPFDFPTVPTA